MMITRMADYQGGEAKVEQQGYDDQQGYGQESYEQQDDSYNQQDQSYTEQKDAGYTEDSSGGYQNQNTP